MFDEMGHSGLVVELVAGAGGHGYAAVDDLSGPVVNDNAEAIIEGGNCHEKMRSIVNYEL